MSVGVQISVREDITKWSDEKRSSLGLFLDELAEGLAESTKSRASRQRAPRKTGRLAKSIDQRKRARGTFEVFSTAPHAIFTEYGTKFIKIGTPEKPRRRWPYQTRRKAATMPWLQTALYEMVNIRKRQLEREIEEYFRDE